MMTLRQKKISRCIFAVSIATAAAISVPSLERASANIHGSWAGFFPNPKSGIVITDDTMFPFVNLMRMVESNNAATSNFPSTLNSANLPNGSLGTALNYTIRLPSNYFGKYVLVINGTMSSGGLVFQGLTTANASGQVYSAPGATLGGCSNGNVPPCVFQNTLGLTGTNPVVTFDFSAPITGATSNSGVVHVAFANVNYYNGIRITTTGVIGSNGNGCGANGTFTLTNVTTSGADLIGSTFPGGCTYTSGGQIFPFSVPASGGGTYYVGFNFAAGSYSGMTSIIACKLADYTADNTCNTTAGKTAWASGFNDDFVTNLASANPHHIRFLDVNSSIFRFATDFAHYPTPSTAWSYNLANDFWVSTRWFGSMSGTNNYALTCSGPCTYTLTGGGGAQSLPCSGPCTFAQTGGAAPVDGDFFQFFNVNANTSANPTLTITDANSVTSSAIPIFDELMDRLTIRVGGTATTSDTVALQFNTTSLGAWACLAGGTHTTSAYTVLNTDTPGTIQAALAAIVNADTTLSALPLAVVMSNPFNGSGRFWIQYANNACALTITPVITGSATETVTIGTLDVGATDVGSLQANTLYSGQYVARIGGIVVNTGSLGSSIGVAWPWQTQIDLVNALSTKTGHGVGCWLQIPLLWSIASFQALATYENSNQCSGGAIYELGNEIGWNTGNGLSGQAGNLASSVGLGVNFQLYETLRSRELFGAGKTIYGSIGTHFFPVMMFQENNASSSAIQGAGLCGTSCSNPAYQNAVGTDYNITSPTGNGTPAQYSYAIGQAPYYNGSIASGSYGPASNYGTWSATSSSVSGNILTVAGTVTGTIWWNQGISSCDGVFISASNPANPATAQLSGTVTTTLNGAMFENSNPITLTSVSGLQVGMWIFDQTTGFVDGTIGSINVGAKQVSISGTTHNTYPSAGANDTMVFGGGPGTYQLNNTTCSAASGTITGGDVLGFQYAIDNYNQINGAIGSQSDGLVWANQDIRLSVVNSNMYPATNVQTVIDTSNNLNAIAVANGQKVMDYEGGLQVYPPTAAQATAIGLPSSAYGNINGYAANLIFGLYNSSYAYNLELARHNFEIGILPSGSKTMYYVYSSNFPWGLFPGGLYSTPYQPFDAVQYYNTH